ncbi:pyrroline-5-carboxylate reductase [Desulfovibrio sp. X2]|uniref:pyrroline-5-carboxylate reductase n=1 Tax=Desulfovibrio sp. X2 TaxID=941449 RepID=UPI000358BD14|nr:pyrroline-5-carboxylate reductase [Desulfovibrio sp. X2]EPR42393.1 pyrroline-5-carboxylate reductase [Desulfovibrio sp. X2]
MASIGFIGTGNMGSAIIRGLAKSGHEIHGTDISRSKVEELARDCGLVPAAAPADVVAACTYIVLAVKPQHMQAMLGSVAPKLGAEKRLISIAAGLTSEKLRAWSGGVCPVVRVMPNTPALVGRGVTAVCFGEASGISEADRNVVREIFGAVGQVHELAEKDLDAFTAVVGSGPAYVFYFMEAMIESAVALGLPRDTATDMVKALFAGSCALAELDGRHLSILREMVTSPAGTTIQALMHMDRTGTRGHIIDAVGASYRRSLEFGK